MLIYFFFLGLAATAGATALGAIPAWFFPKTRQHIQNQLIGLSGGVMLAAACFSLIEPAFGSLASGHSLNLVSLSAVVFFGGLFLLICNRTIPHEHFVFGRQGLASPIKLKRIWLFVFAITLHNFPEGLAVGAALGSRNMELALPVLFGIGLQNLPEGFVVTVALMSVGYSRWQGLAFAGFTGLIEALSAILGFILTSWAALILPWTLVFAGGAMVYVIVNELIPEMQERGHHDSGSLAFLAGFCLMALIDFSL